MKISAIDAAIATATATVPVIAGGIIELTIDVRSSPSRQIGSAADIITIFIDVDGGIQGTIECSSIEVAQGIEDLL